MALTKIKSGQIDDSAQFGVKSVSKTSTFTMTAADMEDCGHLVINNDSSGGAYTVTLPPQADWAGKFITFLHQSGSNAVAFQQYSTSSIVNSASGSAVTYNTVFSDGTLVIFLGANTGSSGPP